MSDESACVYDFSSLCIPLHAEMLRFAKKLTSGDTQRAEDVVQDAFVRALRAWPRFIPDGDVQTYTRAWLYRVVSNTYIHDYHRKRTARRKATECAEDIVDATYSRERDQDPRETLTQSYGDEVSEALSQLTDDHREVINAFYVRELGCAQIAEELGIPKNTVFTRLARARAALVEILAPFAEDEYGYRRVLPAVRASQPAKRPQRQAHRIEAIMAQRDRRSLEDAEPTPDQLAAG